MRHSARHAPFRIICARRGDRPRQTASSDRKSTRSAQGSSFIDIKGSASLYSMLFWNRFSLLGLAIAIVSAGAHTLAADVSPPMFSQILGVQQPHALAPDQVNPQLHGTTPPLLWTAEHTVNELGSDMIKLSLDKRMLERQGLTTAEKPSLTELAKHPLYEQILRLPYRVAFFWAHGSIQFQYYSPAKSERVYQEFYDFTKHLLTTYDNSGKTFMIGNWEGDWLLGAKQVGMDEDCLDENIDRMISWMNVRGKAIEDARKSVPHHNVEVFFYVEVNHVRQAREKGVKRMVNSVLPHTKYTDYVSVSAYDIQSLGNWKHPYDAQSLRTTLFQDLDFVEKHLPERPIRGKRVGIGEIGFPLVYVMNRHRRYQLSEEAAELIQARLAVENAMVNLEWGTTFWLWWAVHNNEPNRLRQYPYKYLGFGLIDQDSGKKRRLWYELKSYNEWAKEFIALERSKTGKNPPVDVFRAAAVVWLKSRVSALREEILEGQLLQDKPMTK